MSIDYTFRTNRDLFSNYYLDEHLPETKAWDEVDDELLREAREDILELWDEQKETAPDRNESQLEEKFIRPMFRKLNIQFEVEESVERGSRRPDYGFFESREAANAAFQRRGDKEGFYEDAIAVADAKRWGRPLDTRGANEYDFQNPSYQIHVYLQKTPVNWAVLTNGKQWRLYNSQTSRKLDFYYEIDLPTLLETGDLEDFKYFYLFFRHAAFIDDAGGDCFLDNVYEESNLFARELGEDLQDNIYEAIKVLAEGFLQFPDNDLSEETLVENGLIEDSSSMFERERLRLIHDSSLIYLYRLIFVLYAESEGRDLLDTKKEVYENSYSLNSLKQEVADELDSPSSKYRDWQTNIWNRNQKLFKLIDKGSESQNIPKDDLYIPAYNGGLFRTEPSADDDREARFLNKYKVGDTYLAKVIELLTRSSDSNGGGKMFVDYSSLDIRHLGGIYEGLLEYQLHIADDDLALDGGEYKTTGDSSELAVEKGEVYLTTDSGERKATGSYYTPEYVVEYIVEHTLGPLIDEMREDLVEASDSGSGGFAEEFAQNVFELKILDPAMGSGHFLTNVVDYLARQIIEAQDRQAEQVGFETIDQSHDINWARRQVAQRCIYGVDLNPLATELAKVSLWLRTLAAEQPLAFLDHHLKSGNSLVGSDIEEIEELESDLGGSESTTLADFGVTKKGTIEQLMRIYRDFIAIENRGLADVKEIEDKYAEFERNKLRRRLEGVANVHTSDHFGLEDIPSGAFEEMANALEDDEMWSKVEQKKWFRDSQKLSTEHRYFHWRLEFPEVFYDDSGESKPNPGFDAIVGNPPYIDSEHMVEHMPDIRNYIAESGNYTFSSGNWDIYCIFIELATQLSKKSGMVGQIVQNKLLAAEYAEKTREEMAKLNITHMRDYSEVNLFEGDTYTVVVVLKNSKPTGRTAIEKMRTGTEIDDQVNFDVDSEIFSTLDSSWSTITHPAFSLLPKLPEQTEQISVDVSGGATVSEAYEIKEIIQDIAPHDSVDEGFKLVNTGTIENWTSKWGVEKTTYIKDQYDRPFVAKNDLENISERRVSQAESEKVIIAGMGKEIKSFYDSEGEYLPAKSTSLIETKHVEFAALLNSRLASLLLNMLFSDLGMSGGYITIGPPQLRTILSHLSFGGDFEPLFDPDLQQMIIEMQDIAREKQQLNLDLLDYIGDVEFNVELMNLGLAQPVRGIKDTVITETEASSSDRNNLKIGELSVEKIDDGTVIVYSTARFKPSNPEEFDELSRGYFETDRMPALEITNLSNREANLIEAFIPFVSKEANGFAGFYRNATKTISLVERIKSISLPEVSQVEEGIIQYTEVKTRGQSIDDELAELTESVNEHIHEIYDLDEEDVDLINSFA